MYNLEQTDKEDSVAKLPLPIINYHFMTVPATLQKRTTKIYLRN